jgi:hypothetical protein
MGANDDPAYAEATPRPMREALREWRREQRKIPDDELATAFRARAAIQAALLSCLCAWPLRKAQTASSHPEWCPAHAMHVSAEAARASAEAAEEPPP